MWNSSVALITLTFLGFLPIVDRGGGAVVVGLLT